MRFFTSIFAKTFLFSLLLPMTFFLKKWYNFYRIGIVGRGKKMQIEKGAHVIYASNGLCCVEECKRMRFSEVEREYWILIPLSSKGSTIYVPTDKPELLCKIRNVLTEEELQSLILRLPREEPMWEEDPALRKDRFRSILEQGCPLEVMKLVRSLCQQQSQREAQGKKLWAFEEHALETARNSLCEEIAYVRKLSAEQAKEFVATHIQG